MPRCRLGREGVAAGLGQFLVHGSRTVRSSTSVLISPSMLSKVCRNDAPARWAAKWLQF